MPGPRNSKAKQKDAMKKGRARATSRRVSQVVVEDPPRPDLESESSPGSDSSGGPPSDPELSRSFEPDPTIVSPSASASPVDLAQFQSPSKISEDFLPAQPCIHDPGNGPRVRDLFDFLKSRFATPPSWDVPDCMEYHYQHVLDFLSELLPYETALVGFIFIFVSALADYCCNRFFGIIRRVKMREYVQFANVSTALGIAFMFIQWNRSWITKPRLYLRTSKI